MLLETLIFTILISNVINRHIDLKKSSDVQQSEHFDQIKSNYTEYFNNIEHYRKDNIKKAALEKVIAIEKDFNRLIAMQGVNYVYKRDKFWRTWRKTKDKEGNEKILNYKCNQQYTLHSTICESCGFWTLENSVPCPYEFYSVIDKDTMCGHHYLETQSYRNECPSIIKFNNLAPTCDNPMITSWRFTTDFGSSQKFFNDICDGKDYCEVLTIYLITPHAVIFRIVNANKNIIYSRIMKASNLTYICVNDCGQYDPDQKETSNIDSPTKLSLTIPHRKNKRHLLKKVTVSEQKPVSMSKNGGKDDVHDKFKINYVTYTNNFLDYFINKLNDLPRLETTTIPSCEKIKMRAEGYDEYENYSPVH